MMGCVVTNMVAVGLPGHFYRFKVKSKITKKCLVLRFADLSAKILSAQQNLNMVM